MSAIVGTSGWVLEFKFNKKIIASRLYQEFHLVSLT